MMISVRLEWDHQIPSYESLARLSGHSVIKLETQYGMPLGTDTSSIVGRPITIAEAIDVNT
jgi:hypothetical protein